MSERRTRRATVEAVAEAMEALAPTAAAQPWDNVGLLAGHRHARVKRVLVTIDLTDAVVDEALEGRAEMVVSYHPPIFQPLRSLVAPGDGMDAVVLRCLAAGIAIYSPHTALDAAPEGTNEVLARLAGAPHPRPPVDPDDPAATLETGILRVGRLARPTTLAALARRLARATGAAAPQRVGPPERRIERVIVLVGSAGDLPLGFVSGAGDAIVTGEMRHHDALAVERRGACAVALGHWASERPALPSLAERLAGALPGVEVTVSGADREPFAAAR